MELNKWQEVLGCEAVFNEKGILEVFANAKVIKMSRQVKERLQYRVINFNHRYLFITSDGAFMSKIAKNCVKIIG